MKLKFNNSNAFFTQPTLPFPEFIKLYNEEAEKLMMRSLERLRKVCYVSMHESLFNFLVSKLLYMSVCYISFFIYF